MFEKKMLFHHVGRRIHEFPFTAEHILTPGGNTGGRGILAAIPTEKESPMTTKELLYVDDALSHAQLLATKFERASDQLQDAALRGQVRQMADQHRRVFRQFYNLV